MGASRTDVQVSRFICSLIVLAAWLAVAGGLCVAAPSSGAPVRFNGNELFSLPAGLNRITVQERAQLVEDRIAHFAKDGDIPASSVHVEEAEGLSDIFAGDVRLLGVADSDAAGSGKSRAQLAGDYASRIRVAVEKYRSDWSWRALFRGILFTLLATAVLLGTLWALARVRDKFRAWRRSWTRHAPDVPALQAAARAFDRPVQSALTVLETVAFWAIILLLFNLYVPLVLSFFPGSSALSQRLQDWVFAPFSNVWGQLVSFLPNLLIIILVSIVTFYAVRLSNILFLAIAKGQLQFGGFYTEWADPTSKLMRVLIVLLAVVVVYPYLPGSESAAFKGISVFIGVLLSLGSSSAVANAFAGTILIYARAFHVGDRVRVGDSEGDVIERTIFVTRLRTIKNEVITVPNSTILSGPVTNFSGESGSPGLILHTTLTIGYDAPWPQVQDLLIKAASSTPRVLASPSPYVLQTALNDFNVSYQINAYTDRPNEMALIYSDLHSRIQDEFNKAGVEIMSPGYTAIRDGNTVTIPPEERPQGYRPPSFRVDGTNPGTSSGGPGF